MPKPPKHTNFDYLPAGLPRTRRIIDAALSVNVPWQPEQAPVWEPSKLAELAERIRKRADQGKPVTLKSQTAQTVAVALTLVAEGAMTTDRIRKEYTISFRIGPMNHVRSCVTPLTRRSRLVHLTLTRHNIRTVTSLCVGADGRYVAIGVTARDQP